MERSRHYSGVAVRGILVLFVVFGLSAAAERVVFAQHEHGQGPCAGDVQKFCKDVKPGGGRIAICLKEHQNDLSPACKEKIAEVKEEIKEVHEACQGDVQQFCKGVQPGGGRIARCLKEHKDELSAGCKGKIGEMKEKRGGKRPATGC